MEKEVDKSVVAKTVHCKRSYSCLSESNNSCCAIKHCINKQVYFTNRSGNACGYTMFFGGSSLCTCPVRKAIYDKYKV